MDIPDILTIVAVIFMILCKVCLSMPLSKIAIAFLALSILLAIVKRL